jgi:hypothetical protein
MFNNSKNNFPYSLVKSLLELPLDKKLPQTLEVKNSESHLLYQGRILKEFYGFDHGDQIDEDLFIKED